MSDRSVAHATFAIERVYDASPARVFEAWSDPVAKKRWFGPEDTKGSYELDFRIGGSSARNWSTLGRAIRSTPATRT